MQWPTNYKYACKACSVLGAIDWWQDDFMFRLQSSLSYILMTKRICTRADSDAPMCGTSYAIVLVSEHVQIVIVIANMHVQ